MVPSNVLFASALKTVLSDPGQTRVRFCFLAPLSKKKNPDPPLPLESLFLREVVRIS